MEHSPKEWQIPSDTLCIITDEASANGYRIVCACVGACGSECVCVYLCVCVCVCVYTATACPSMTSSSVTMLTAMQHTVCEVGEDAVGNRCVRV